MQGLPLDMGYYHYRRKGQPLQAVHPALPRLLKATRRLRINLAKTIVARERQKRQSDHFAPQKGHTRRFQRTRELGLGASATRPLSVST